MHQRLEESGDGFPSSHAGRQPGARHAAGSTVAVSSSSTMRLVQRRSLEAATSEAASLKPSEGPVDMEQFKNDPLVQKALEVFKGQIVDVRT